MSCMQLAAGSYAAGKVRAYASDWVVYQVELHMCVTGSYLVQDLDAFIHHLAA